MINKTDAKKEKSDYDYEAYYFFFIYRGGLKSCLCRRTGDPVRVEGFLSSGLWASRYILLKVLKKGYQQQRRKRRLSIFNRIATFSSSNRLTDRPRLYI